MIKTTPFEMVFIIRESMSADVNELFDRIFAESDLANHYLASLMSWSEDKETVEIKRKQVQLLRDYFINRNGDSSGKYLSLLEDIERILARDSDRFVSDADTTNDTIK